MTAPGGGGGPESVVGIVSGLVSIPFFILANALFVAAEFALVSVRRTRVKELVEQGVKGARNLERATNDLDRYIAATQLGITLASILLGWLGQPALARAVLPAFEWLGPSLSDVASRSFAFAVAFFAISFLHVVLGELAPKTVALQVPDRVALWIAGPLQAFERIFRPFIWTLNSFGSWFVRLMGFKPAHGALGQVHSVVELTHLMEASETAGVLERQEREMMHGVLAFGDMTVRQLMTPKADITSVCIKDSPHTIVQAALEGGYSRLPVYESTPDEIIGVIHVKDLLNLYAEAERDVVVIQDMLREPYFVKATTRVLDLLREFQRGENHMSFVIDDFGELLGLVTLEDLLEEIVGEIRDEYDVAEPEAKLDQDGSFLVPGRASARDCLSDLGVIPPLWAGGSISDFLRQVQRGRLKAGNVVRYEDLTFTVLDADASGAAVRVRAIKEAEPK